MTRTASGAWVHDGIHAVVDALKVLSEQQSRILMDRIAAHVPSEKKRVIKMT